VVVHLVADLLLLVLARSQSAMRTIEQRVDVLISVRSVPSAAGTSSRLGIGRFRLPSNCSVKVKSSRIER